MKHLGTVRLETSRLILRRFTTEDARAMYDNWARDPEVTKYLTWPAYKSVDTANTILGIWTENYQEETFYQWAIELKELGQPIGSISVVSCDDRAEKAELGYCIGKTWWGQGIVAEALNAVLDFLFAEVEANRIEARHAAQNPNSGKVMEKCGMKYEGTLRKSDWCNAGICDFCVWAVLREDWKS